MIKINKTFLFVFLLTNIPFLYAYFYDDPNGLVSVDFSLSEAIVLHVLCTVFFLAGYFLPSWFLEKVMLIDATL